MATKVVSVVTGGSNSHETSSAEINGIATDFISEGVVGAVSNTSGVAPSTGAFAVNALGTPTMDVRVTGGVAYVTATPTGGSEQTFRVTMDSTEDVTIAANSTGGTRYDWVYIKLDADKLVNPAVAADDVATLTTSRSTSSSTDNGTPPTYGYCIAVVTVSNGASSITNSNITDSRVRTGANSVPSTALVHAKSLYNPYKFSVYRAAAANTGNGAFAKLSFDTEVYDTNNNFSSGTYTAPVDGFYSFSSFVEVNTTADAVQISVALYKNGSVHKRLGLVISASVVNVGCGGSALVQSAAGDTWDIYVFATTTKAIQATENQAWFTGHLVSTT